MAFGKINKVPYNQEIIHITHRPYDIQLIVQPLFQPFGRHPFRYPQAILRFLCPLVSMPDIDIDFCFERRQEVIDYVGKKYGSDKVVQIVTFLTMAAKGVIRDVGRVMDLPYAPNGA